MRRSPGYTAGSHVVVGSAGADRHTLAHELAHVLQQRQGPVTGVDRGDGVRVSDPSDAFERRAEADARRISAGRPTPEATTRAARRRAGRAQSDPRIQRARLNLRNNGTISGLSQYPSRPPSNVSGMQGQHRTAYVVFEDMMRNRVVDRTVADAAAALLDVITEIRALPGLQGGRNVGWLLSALNGSAARMRANPDAGQIGAEIDELLRIRNQVPGTAVRGVGGGHDEHGQSATIRPVEDALRRDAWPAQWSEQVVADQVRAAMWRLLDYDPAPPAPGPAQQPIVKVLLTHYLSLRSAYPHTWDWLTDNGYYLRDYLVAHNGEDGMPLPRFSGPAIFAILGTVVRQM